MIPWLPALVAAVASCAATGIAVTSGPVDAPKDRGLHHRPTPTAGGIAILLGCGLGVILALINQPGLHNPRLASTLGLAFAMGLLGAADDVFDLGARLKLMVQIAFALIFTIAVARVEALSTPFGMLWLGPVIGALGSALWIVVVSNAVNFMDGANGLSPGGMVIALAALALATGMSGAGGVAALALIAAAAGLGFLPWNLPGGRIFQGDVGALFSSTLFAGLVIVSAGRSGELAISLWLGPVILLPFLTDVFLTLLSRARRRESLLKAHREHLFQRWLLATGKSHGALSLRFWGLMLGASAVALWLNNAPIGLRSVAFIGALAVAIAVWFAINRKIRPSG